MKRILIISIIMCAMPLYFAITIYPISAVQVSRAESFEMEEPQIFYYCGDANNDGTVDIDDAVYLLEYIFQSGPACQPFPEGEPVMFSARMALLDDAFAGPTVLLDDHHILHRTHDPFEQEAGIGRLERRI